MPEGPEVEHVRLSLLPIISKKVNEIKLTELSQKYQKYKNKQREFDIFRNRKVEKIERVGKFLIWVFDCKTAILNHLGMSGKWLFIKDENISSIRHAKVMLNIEELSEKLIFDDVRNFGQFRIFESYDAIMNYKPIKSNGLDGLVIPFPQKEFLLSLDKPNYANREIGSILLDQKLVSGIGNIYKSEALYAARINPTRIVKDISVKERKKLGIEISNTLQLALAHQGSTFSIQPFQSPDGREGSAQNWHKVYGKYAKPCQECATEISRIKQNGRSTFFCSNCQK